MMVAMCPVWSVNQISLDLRGPVSSLPHERAPSPVAVPPRAPYQTVGRCWCGSSGDRPLSAVPASSLRRPG